MSSMLHLTLIRLGIQVLIAGMLLLSVGIVLWNIWAIQDVGFNYWNLFWLIWASLFLLSLPVKAGVVAAHATERMDEYVRTHR